MIRDRDARMWRATRGRCGFVAKVVASFTDAHLAHAVKIVASPTISTLVAACEKLAQDTLGETVSAERSQPY